MFARLLRLTAVLALVASAAQGFAYDIRGGTFKHYELVCGKG